MCLTFVFSTAQETLIANLNAQLARKDPTHRTDQQVFEILTREEANREMRALQAEVNEWKKRYQNAEKKFKEKEDEISTLQQRRSYISLLSLLPISCIEHNHYLFFFFSQRMIYALSYKRKSIEGRLWRTNFNACLLQHLVLEQAMVCRRQMTRNSQKLSNFTKTSQISLCQA